MSESNLCQRCHKCSVLNPGDICESCVEYLEFLKEDVTVCPLELEQADFERFIRKLTIHAYDGRPAEAAQVSLDHLERHLKEAILKELPAYYVSMFEYDPAKKRALNAEGSYVFKTRLPQEVLYRIVEKLGLWKRIDPEDPSEDWKS